ncbi:Cilia and flagella associated protein 46 [Desmophyllum pertusum]|uniref:Cilia and flagella associated protein 46 n=1 Tax=Desmophyllum pertusum TaxID=174260 RepID=A0A9X0D7A3_9CNID|nr:Cilia and flagella associated protein 46 [Desmophyllum pertusum]
MDDENLHSQGPMCRALCAVEMLSLQNNGLPEFTGTCPTLPEVSARFMLFNALGMSVIGLEAKQECDRLENQ